jgi:hypothetical protein
MVRAEEHPKRPTAWLGWSDSNFGKPRHVAETDCMAGHIGLELRCAKRKFISLNVRQYSDLPAPVQTRHVAFRE